MSRDRDPVEDGIEKVGGAIVGLIIVAAIAYLLGNARKNSQKDFAPPDSLAVNYSDPNFVPPEARPWWVKRNFLWVTLCLMGAMLFGSLSIQTLSVSSQRGSPVSLEIVFWLWGAGGCAAALYYLEEERKDYIDKRSKYVPDLRGVPSQAVQVYVVTLPKDTLWQPQSAGRFMQQILLKSDKVVFQIVAKPGRIGWRILEYSGAVNPMVIHQAIAAFYPQAEVTDSPLKEPEFTKPFYRLTRAVCQQQPFINPIAYVSDFAKFDPLVNLVQEMDTLQAGERIAYTLAVTGAARFVYQQALDALTIKVPLNPFDIASAAYRIGAEADARTSQYSEEDLEVYATKLEHLVYQGVLFIQVDAASEQRAWDLLSLTSQVAQFDRPSFNRLAISQDGVGAASGWIKTVERMRETTPTGLLDRWCRNLDGHWKPYRLLLDTQELAALWHLPHKDFQARSLIWRRGKQVPMSERMKHQRDGVRLGLNRFGGAANEVYLLDKDRTTPMAIIGKAGVGKSNLLHHMIHQDIARGQGVVVIDPHGKLVTDILECSIPESREKDVVLLDLNDLSHPPPLNPMRGLNGSVAVGRVMDILDKMYDDLRELHQTSDALENALVTLRADPQATLWDIDRLFRDERYRNELLLRIDDPIVHTFWSDEYANAGENQRRQISGPIFRRIRTFYRSTDLRSVLCNPQGLNFAQLIKENRIVLLSLRANEDIIPESERFLIGALVIARLQMAAISGAFADRPCYCYVDELQNFVTSSISKVFSEARKFNLFLTVANQYTRQLTGDTLDAAIGNIGTLVVFQVGEPDARTLSPYLQPNYEAEDLVNLDKYKAVVWMRFDDQSENAFSLETDKPLERPNDARSRRERIRRYSIEQYTPWSQKDVLEWLSQRYSQPSPNGRPSEDKFYDPIDPQERRKETH